MKTTLKFLKHEFPSEGSSEEKPLRPLRVILVSLFHFLVWFFFFLAGAKQGPQIQQGPPSLCQEPLSCQINLVVIPAGPPLPPRFLAVNKTSTVTFMATFCTLRWAGPQDADTRGRLIPFP